MYLLPQTENIYRAERYHLCGSTYHGNDVERLLTQFKLTLAHVCALASRIDQFHLKAYYGKWPEVAINGDQLAASRSLMSPSTTLQKLD